MVLSVTALYTLTFRVNFSSDIILTLFLFTYLHLSLYLSFFSALNCILTLLIFKNVPFILDHTPFS